MPKFPKSFPAWDAAMREVARRLDRIPDADLAAAAERVTEIDDTEEIGDRCPYCGGADHYCSSY